jgi:hypothetical protein
VDFAAHRTGAGLEPDSQSDQAVLTGRWLTLAFRAALVAIVGLFVAAGLFAHPVADDFDYASLARETGVSTAWRQHYLTWNGRYTSNLLVLAIPLPGDTLVRYRTAVASLLAVTVVALYMFLRSLAPGDFTAAEIATGAFALCVLYLCQMPSLGEGIYWYTSAVTYHAALVVAALHFACVAHRWKHGTRPPLVVGVALLVAVAGFNEVIMVMMLVLYAALMLLAASRQGPDRIAAGTLLATAVVCAIIVAGSPGNAARAAEFPLRHQLGRSLMLTALQTVRFLAAWVSSGPLLVASVLWLSQAGRLGPAPELRQRRLHLMLCVAGILLVVPLSTFPAYWATGMLGQHRTMNTAYFAFLILWFIALGLWSAADSARAGAVRAAAVTLRTPLTLVLLMSLALTQNSYAVGADLMSGRFSRFDERMRQRNLTLRHCREAGRATCEIDPIEIAPASFFVLDISADPRDWVNVAYARYFGLAQVRRRPVPFSDHVRY